MLMHQPSRRAAGVAGARGRRERPLGHLRAAVLRGDDQLHRPPGHRHPEADAAAAVRLDRDRLRRHRLRVPARLRDRPAARRAASWIGSARGAGSSSRSSSGASRRWLHAEATRHRRAAVALLAACRPDLLGVGRRVHRRAVPARPRRSRQLPGGDQGRRGVVSEAGARASPPASSTRARTSARC